MSEVKEELITITLDKEMAIDIWRNLAGYLDDENFLEWATEEFGDILEKAGCDISFYEEKDDGEREIHRQKLELNGIDPDSDSDEWEGL